MASLASRTKLRAAFDAVDKDNSGSIDLKELEGLCKSLSHPIDFTEVSALFNEIDTNHDGKISFEEFIAWYRLGKDTNLKGFLKSSLRHLMKYNEKLPKLKKSSSLMSGTKLCSAVDIEVLDGEPVDATTVQFQLMTDVPTNAFLHDRMKKACPTCFTNPQSMIKFIQLETNNAQAVKDAINEFFEAILEMGKELAPQFESCFDAQIYEVGCDGNTVFVCFDLLSQPMASPYCEMGFGFIEMLKLCLIDAKCGFECGKDFHAAMKMGHFSELIRDFRAWVKVGYNPTAKEFIRSMEDQFITPQGNRFDDMIVYAMNRLFSSVKMRIKLNSHDPKKLFDSMNDYGAGLEDVPSTYADFKNEAVEAGNGFDVKGMKEGYPFVDSLLNALNEHALFDTRIGLMAWDAIHMSFRVKGHGLKEIYDDILNSLD